jgi:peptide/nickel transport system ATP-binding protein
VNGSLLDVQNLSVFFQTERGMGTAVDHIGFSMGAGDSLGIVGESGC